MIIAVALVIAVLAFALIGMQIKLSDLEKRTATLESNAASSDQSGAKSSSQSTNQQSSDSSKQMNSSVENKNTVTTGANVTSSSTITEVISAYYKNKQPANQGELKILAQTVNGDKNLVLAQKNWDTNWGIIDLFIVSSNKQIERHAQGQVPLSMCFLVNVLEYDNKTILFGSFNNSKWRVNPDERVPVDIQNIKVSFNNGETFSQKVGKGFIVISKTASAVTTFDLFDDKGVLQSDLSDLRKYGSVFNEASFVKE